MLNGQVSVASARTSRARRLQRLGTGDMGAFRTAAKCPTSTFRSRRTGHERWCASREGSLVRSFARGATGRTSRAKMDRCGGVTLGLGTRSYGLRLGRESQNRSTRPCHRFCDRSAPRAGADGRMRDAERPFPITSGFCRFDHSQKRTPAVSGVQASVRWQRIAVPPFVPVRSRFGIKPLSDGIKQALAGHVHDRFGIGFVLSGCFAFRERMRAGGSSARRRQRRESRTG